MSTAVSEGRVRGKIIKSLAGFYEVHTGREIYRCRARGVFRALHEKPLVGDDVEIEITDELSTPKEGNVTALLQRKNDLIRPNVANVDQALLLFAITRPQPSFQTLDRLLITVRQKGLPAVICFSKKDLATQEQLAELRRTYENCGCIVLFISALEAGSLQQDKAKEDDPLGGLRAVLRGKTTVITGPSGAGKSTLINLLCPQANMETGGLSEKIGRGRNTTRHVELLTAGENTYVVDTPGFTSLELRDIGPEDVRDYYPEFVPFAKDCRFAGCNHMAEPGCAVKEAVRCGRISGIRYRNYTQIFTLLRDRKPVYH
jgi:ribosome biogenesis GTPase